MAELGSHQLDACSIFLGKVHPLAVSGVGLKCYYNDDREIEDHVYCTYEFPGKDYQKTRPVRDPDTRLPNYNPTVAVTYSSVTTNAFENYGECVMGSKGTLVVQSESEAMLYPPAFSGRSTSVTVTTQSSGQPVLDSWGSLPAPGAASSTPRNAGVATYSRGYREEMEHLAYCIRMRDQGMNADREDLKPRCHGLLAMGDALIALGANQAFQSQRREVFEEAWFGAGAEVPEWDATIVPR
jgi:predicted dehydrogenase